LINTYRALEERLRTSRKLHPPGSPEEASILEEMAIVWYKLSDQEREQLNSEGPTCWPDNK